MYECEIGQGLLGNSVARAVGGAVQNATLPLAGEAGYFLSQLARWLLPGYGVDEPETGIEGGDWCQTRPMRLTKGGLPPFSRLPGTLVRLPVEVRSKTALIL